MPSSIKQTQMRLGDEALADLARIAEHYGLPARNRTAAARIAIREWARHLAAGPGRVEKKKRGKNSAEGD